MTKKRKKIITWALLSALLIMVTGGVVGYKMYTKPHRSVKDAKTVRVSAPELVSAYDSNEAEANAQYLDKVLEVKGEIIEISKNQKEEPVITLKGTDMSGIICTFEGTATSEIKLNSSVVIKGICTGFLTDVVLVRCIFESR
jgi:putative exporter of polyketide antibiotics